MLQTIISLSFVLACGFLLVILSCALFNNWLPLLVVATYLVAPLPNIVCGRIAQSGDYLSEEPSGAAVDFGRFLTGVLCLTGLSLPIMLYHVGEITQAAMVMSILGGLLIYGSIIAYSSFFAPRDDF